MQFSSMTPSSSNLWSVLLLVLVAAASMTSTTEGFVVVRPTATTATTTASYRLLATTDNKAASESAFVPPDAAAAEEDTEEAQDEDDALAKAESLGRGAAKKKRGRRKGGKALAGKQKKKKVSKAALAPEETFYEGPPAISETIAPTASILTVVGIIPAAAAWARQAWVRYKITSRRIRVTSGVGGSDMAEIVYPDIVEIRTAKRLFGDGDMVAFLSDGAKFEMRNIPNFEETMEFILKQVNPDVAKAYREKGDVTEKES